jgi:CPA2 family monovalent cation:H+ antiporter-2
MHGDSALLIELGAVILVLGVVAGLAKRIGLSAVPLFLLTGLALGEGGLAPLENAFPFVDVAAEIGLILLMLTLGLEFSAREFIAGLRHQAPAGLVDMVLNATPGALLGLALGLDLAGVLALAGVTWVSSSGIVARTLGELGRLANRETPAVLSVLVLEDVAMAVFLPTLAVLAAGTGWVAGVVSVGGAVAAVTVAIVASRRFPRGIGRVVSGSDDEQVLLRVMGLTLLVAGVTQALDASSAVGAFLVGLALDGPVADRARVVLTPMRDFLAAIFFLAFGLSTDPRAIGPLIPAAVGLAVVTIATKVATGWYAAGRDGVGARGRLRAGAVLTPRGEFSIVIAGLVAGAATQVGPLATAYVMVTAVTGPILARVADPLGRRWMPQGVGPAR